MNAFAHTVFAAWHSILSRGPKWIVRGYLLLGAGFSKRFFSDDVATDTVFAVGADSLKKLVHDGERVLLKIDVEGYEAELLESLIAFVDVHNADLIVEVLTGAEVAISSWALTHGYSTAMIMGDGHMVSGPVTAHAVHRDWLLQRESKPDARPSIA